MKANGATELPSNRAVVLDNVTCPYCGVELDEKNNTKEHVIGRRFVPKGSLNGNWNLIVRACQECNSYKSVLENDISAITLSGALWPCSVSSDENTRIEALRKARNSISIRTGKPVLHSQEELKFEIPFASGETIKLNTVSPPQIDSERLFRLARMHMMAFFYFVTFKQDTKKGGFWPENFYPLPEAHHQDWGNSLHRAFMEKVVDWEPRLIGNTAGGFFKSIIRRHPNAECWSWAIEWNKSYRIVGFFGSSDASMKILNSFQKPEMITLVMGESRHIKVRKEVKLSEEDDLLFRWKE